MANRNKRAAKEAVAAEAQTNKTANQRGSGRNNRRPYPNRRTDSGNGSPNYRPSAVNDLSWYTKNPLILAAVSNLPATYRTGQDMNIGSVHAYSVSDGIETQSRMHYNLPGIMTINWAPTVGYSATSQDPASQAALEMYTKVRAAYSGSLPYDAPDIMMYVMALDSIYAYIAHLKRIYRCVSAYSDVNVYTPRAVIEALGFTTEQFYELVANKIRLYDVINQLIGQVSSFYLPDVMTIVHRHYWLSSNIYADNNTAKSQWYMFNPVGFYKFTAFTAKGGELTLEAFDPAQFSDSHAMISDMYNYGITMIMALKTFEETMTISGQLQGAYSNAKPFSVAPLLVGEGITIVYEEEVLQQIENSFFFGYTIDYDRCKITQDPTTNAVLCDPVVLRPKENPTYAFRYGEETKHYFNYHKDKVEPADIVISTRLHPSIRTIKANDNEVDWDYHLYTGSEIPVSCVLTYTDTSSGEPIFKHNVVLSTQGPAPTEEHAWEYTANFDTLMRVTNFKHHPSVLVFRFIETDESYSPYTYFFPLGDAWTPMLVKNDDLFNLHKVCLYSEFSAFVASV